ncbi:MAG: hypothetical protein AB7F43_12925 [Bacteriovoracia bacterium]
MVYRIQNRCGTLMFLALFVLLSISSLDSFAKQKSLKRELSEENTQTNTQSHYGSRPTNKNAKKQKPQKRQDLRKSNPHLEVDPD